MNYLLTILKLCVLAFLLSIFLASYFHTRESGNMEKRLGIKLPHALKIFMNLHILITLFSLAFVSFLFIF